MVQPCHILGYRQAIGNLPPQGVARQGDRIAGRGALDDRTCAVRPGLSQDIVDRARAGIDTRHRIGRVIGVDHGDHTRTDVGIARGQARHHAAGLRHWRQQNTRLAALLPSAKLAGIIAEHQAHARLVIAQITHIGRLKRDQHRIKALRPGVASAVQHRQNLIDQQTLAANFHIAELAQGRQSLRIPAAIEHLGELRALRLRQRQSQYGGAQHLTGPRCRQGKTNGQVLIGTLVHAGQAIGRAIQHTLAARGVTQRRHRYGRGKLARHRVIDRKLEAIAQPVIGQSNQFA